MLDSAPSLILRSILGLGYELPRKIEAGFDPLVLQAYSGMN